MTHRLTRWLRPLAFAGATAAVAAIWWHYGTSPELAPNLPGWVHSSWLTPLYAIPRLAPDQVPNAPMARPAVDLLTSPVFDRLLLASLVALVCAVLLATAVARRWWTPVVLLLTVLGVTATNVYVCRITNGDTSVVEPFARHGLEYNTDTQWVRDDPLAFIRDYPQLNQRGGISHHAGTHPPGGVLFLYFGKKYLASAEPPPPPPVAVRQRTTYERLFGGGPRPQPVRRAGDQSHEKTLLDTAVYLAIGVTSLAVLPAWWLARTIGGAAAARRLLPMYLATPNLVLYGATCMDGVFLTFCLTALAAGVAAIRTRWHALWTPLLTIVAGISLWLASFMTFAAVAVPLLMGFYAVCAGIRDWRRGANMLARCVLVGVIFIACQLVARSMLGYDLNAVVRAAMERDFSGVRVTGYESLELWRDYSIANLLAWLVGSGVAIAGLGLTAMAVALLHGRLRGGGMACFAPAVALCMLTLATSTLFTLETERVWLFLTPALLVVATTQFRGVAIWTLLITLSFVQVFWMETQYYVYW